MTIIDLLALSIFFTLWLAFVWLTDGTRQFSRISLNSAMIAHRSQWIKNSLKRDLRMIDTQILAGLQNGTSFFASASILALGGCISLYGVLESRGISSSDDLNFIFAGGRAALEIKLAGFTGIFGYAFFKFGWAYRLFNYCSILFGGLPMPAEAAKDPAAAERAASRVIALNIIAAKNFNGGLRAIFLSIGYLGWFAGPYVFMVATVFVIAVLLRRQFYSEARDALLADLDNK